MSGGLPSPSSASVAWSELGALRVGVLASEVEAVLGAPPVDGSSVIDLAEALGAPFAEGGLARKWVRVAAVDCWLGLGTSLRIAGDSHDRLEPLPAFVEELGRALGIAAVVTVDEGFGYLVDPRDLARLSRAEGERGEGGNA